MSGNLVDQDNLLLAAQESSFAALVHPKVEPLARALNAAVEGRESLDLARYASDTPLRVFKAAAMEESRRNQACRDAEQMLERFKE